MKSDVKAVRKNSTGSVFAGRTRLRGIILASDGGGADGGGADGGGAPSGGGGAISSGLVAVGRLLVSEVARVPVAFLRPKIYTESA